MKQEQKWESYEEVARHILDQFAEDFKMGKFEGKQAILGESGTSWEVDAKGCSEGDETFLVVECKRHARDAINQAITGSLAYVIKDVGASGGISVSPRGLQEGAKKVAAAENIVEVKLELDSTTSNYVAAFLEKLVISRSAEVNLSISESFRVVIKDKDGNVVEDREVQG